MNKTEDEIKAERRRLRRIWKNTVDAAESVKLEAFIEMCEDMIALDKQCDVQALEIQGLLKENKALRKKLEK